MIGAELVQMNGFPDSKLASQLVLLALKDGLLFLEVVRRETFCPLLPLFASRPKKSITAATEFLLIYAWDRFRSPKRRAS